MDKFAYIFSDGSSRGNPGPSGWGSVVFVDDRVEEIGGFENLSTNNAMEIRASIEALKFLRNFPNKIVMLSDSTYLKQGITLWIPKWRENGWQTANKQDVKNQNEWRELDELIGQRPEGGSVIWKKVPGHSGVLGNERADKIATGFALRRPPNLFSGYATDYFFAFDPAKFINEPLIVKQQKNSKKDKNSFYYLSLVGGVLQRHTSWQDCENRTLGVSGARYKRVFNEAEEASVLKGWRDLGLYRD